LVAGRTPGFVGADLANLINEAVLLAARKNKELVEMSDFDEAIDRYLMTRPELLDRLAVLLGGRVAEELVFGEISTGAQNDLQRATDIARSMVAEYGMSDRLGLVTYERPRQPLFLPGNYPSPSEE
jgi:ATP-dependent Zn protease